MVSTSPSAFPPTPPSEPSNNMDANAALNGVPTAPGTEHQHIWVITGPAGCGKTSVAEFLHETYSLPYLEGDTVSEFHSYLCCHRHTNAFCVVPHARKCTKDGRRPTPYGCRQMGLADRPPRSSHLDPQEGLLIARRHRYVQRAQAKIPGRYSHRIIP